MKSLSTTVLPARLDYLPSFIEAVTKSAIQGGVNDNKIFSIELALEEVLVNIMNYAYEGSGGDITVTCRSDNRQCFTIEITDNGKPFDMTAIPPPDLSGDLSERPIGGLGIHFVKKLSDRVHYQRTDDKNILEIEISLLPPVVHE